ncbi:MAG: restriction endonuclease subunit S [Dehalococcoidia bacterium]
MADEWANSRLADLSVNFDGRRRPVKESDRRSGPYPYYGASGIVDHVDGFLFDGEYLLVAEDGENLRTRQTPIAFLARGRFWVNNHAHIITGNERADTRFLMYALRHVDIDAYLTGAVMPKLTQGNLNRIEVSHPPLAEQRAIADVLGALDDKIEQNQRTARALERLAQAIFRAWFVDLEPVKAKTAGATSFPGMPQPVFDALPTRFIDSDIGPVPEGWEVGTVSDLAVLSKEQVNPQDLREEHFEHFSIPAFDAGQNPVVELGAAIKSNKFLVVDGCVLLSKLNPRIPRVWLPPTTDKGRPIASTEFLVLIPSNGFDRHYLYCQFQQPAFREDLARSASGTSNSHQRVRPNDLLAKPVLIPSATARHSFQEIVVPLFALLASSHIESRRLAAMRDYLLPKLLSGYVRVILDSGSKEPSA